jgi:Ca2+-binding RTX toxin-like protein
LVYNEPSSSDHDDTKNGLILSDSVLTTDDLIDIISDSDIIFGGMDGEMLVATSRNSFIFGGPGDDYIEGGIGFNLFVGGDGADIFVISKFEYPIIIEDFELGVDKLGIRDFQFEDLAFRQDQGDAMITYGGNSIARVVGLLIDDLATKANFMVL